MSNPQQCPSCGARNPADAAWCTQCYESLATEPAAVSSAAGGAAAGDGAVTRPPRTADRTATLTEGLLPLPGDQAEGPGARRGPARDGEAASIAAGDGRFRRAPDGLEWSCDVCSAWNPMELSACADCGSPFLGEEAEQEPAPDVDPSVLAVATVVLPGAGHALLGQHGQAFWRALLALVWGVGGVLLLLRGLASGQSVLPAVPLLLGWLALVVTSVNDVLVARGASGRVLLEGRALLWLVISVVGGTMGAVFVGAFGAVNG